MEPGRATHTGSPSWSSDSVNLFSLVWHSKALDLLSTALTIPLQAYLMCHAPRANYRLPVRLTSRTMRLQSAPSSSNGRLFSVCHTHLSDICSRNEWSLHWVDSDLSYFDPPSLFYATARIAHLCRQCQPTLCICNNTTKQIQYRDCVPTSLGDIQFESTSTGDTFITFNASFRFSYFELKSISSTGAITNSFTVTRT